MTVRVVVEINYNIEVLGLKGICEDLHALINSGTRYGRVRRAYLEAKPAGELTKTENYVEVILYDSHDGGFK